MITNYSLQFQCYLVNRLWEQKNLLARGYSLDKTPNSPCFIYKKLYRSQKGEILIGSWDLKSYVLTGISFTY